MIYYALLLFFVLEYVRPGTYVPLLSVLRLNTITPAIVVLGTIMGKTKVSNEEAFGELNTRLIFGFLGLIFVSILTADVTLYAYSIFVRVAGYVAIYWVLIKQLDDLARIKGVFKTLVAVHLILAALTPEMFTDPDARHFLSSGTFLGDGNDYALSVNVAIPFCLFLMFDAKKTLTKLMYGGMLVVLLLCIVATKSRGGTLALLCVAGYYWLKSHKKVLTAALAVAGVALIVLSAPETYFTRMSTISADPQDSSAQRRLGAWNSGVRMALDNPILGVGAGQFPGKLGREYRPPGHLDTGRWMTAHSIYFLVLGELGFPGIIVLLTFIFANLAANRRLGLEVKSRGPDHSVTDTELLACLSASVIAFATGGAFLSAVYYPHMFVIGGLLVAGRRVVRSRLAEERAPAPVAVETSLRDHWRSRNRREPRYANRAGRA